jgi:predicted CoA-binding protein
MKVLVIGASNNPDRYSFKAIEMLLEYKHQPIPFSQKKAEVCGLKIENEWKNWEEIHTVTLYINPKLQEAYYDLIIGLKPKRVIFNPGTENKDFQRRLISNTIEAMEACTLVMLRTNQF